jgi:hypothetical protein
LIIETLRHVGMGQEHVELLLAWASGLNGGSANAAAVRRRS